MKWKSLAIIAVLLSIALAPAALAAQAANQSVPAHQTSLFPATPVPAAPVLSAPASAPSSPSTVAPASTANPATQTNCEGAACDAALPHITIATPAPAPAPWPLQDRIAWAASLLLTIMAYVGIMLALSALRKIERQTRYAETAAQAAANSAKAALLVVQTQAEAERPWILVTVEAAPGIPYRFIVVVTNRGRIPARILSLAEKIVIAKDESGLPPTPAFNTAPRAPRIPFVLLPGESAGIKSFGRNEILSMCENREQLRRVEDWDDKIYLCGKIAYRSLLASGEEPAYETAWCCWYINSSQKCGMVMAAPPDYTQHT